MKSMLLALAVVPLSACTMHVYVHQVREPEHATTIAHESPGVGVLSGVVLDAQRKPVRAHVGAIVPGGSVTCGTGDDGRFELDCHGVPSATLIASTDDSRVFVLGIVRASARDLELVVRPGASVHASVSGVERTRCAVLAGELRIADFTLRAGPPETIVVPAGDIVVRLYDGDTDRDVRTLHLAIGDSKRIDFAISD